MNKTDRINSEIKKQIAFSISHEIENPRLKDGLISIIKVETDKDLTLSKVFYSVYANKKYTLSEIENALLSAKGFIKNCIKERLKIRKIPDIRFIYDSSMDYAIKLEKILRSKDDENERN